MGLCLLLFLTQAAAAANGEPATAPARDKRLVAKAEPARPLSLEERLTHALAAARERRSVIRVFANHRWLLTSADDRVRAQAVLRRARHDLARAERTLIAIRRVLHRREASAPPKVAICDVFGRRYCAQALSVAWCESRHSTRATNGEYLGLFQMGSYERQLYGHGSTARQQARAAHRYFVVTGRDWSPWSCKPRYV